MVRTTGYSPSYVSALPTVDDEMKEVMSEAPKPKPKPRRPPATLERPVHTKELPKLPDKVDPPKAKTSVDVRTEQIQQVRAAIATSVGLPPETFKDKVIVITTEEDDLEDFQLFDAPPVSRYDHAVSPKRARFIKTLKENPGKWAVLPVGHEKSQKSIASSIKKGLKGFGPGFDARYREGQVWVSYQGQSR